MIRLPAQVAVIVPVHDDAINLSHCLRALLRARSDRSIPVCVIDDGSTDDSSAIAATFDVQLVRGDGNRGPGWARNHGAALVDAEYILFVDSDVLVPDDLFDRLDRFLVEDRPVGSAGLQGTFSLEHPFPEWSSLTYNTLQHLLSNQRRERAQVNTSLLFIPKAALADVGGFREDLRLMEDTDLGLRLAKHGHFVQQDNLLFVHRKRATWSWLFRVYFRCGKALGVLNDRGRSSADPEPRALPAHHRADPRALEAAQPSKRPSDAATTIAPRRLFLVWMGVGLTLLTALALLTTANRAAAIGGCSLLAAACVVWIVSCRQLWTVRRQPLFLFVAGLCYLTVPWLIVVGRLVAIVRPVASGNGRSR